MQALTGTHWWPSELLACLGSIPGRETWLSVGATGHSQLCTHSLLHASKQAGTGLGHLPPLPHIGNQCRPFIGRHPVHV